MAEIGLLASIIAVATAGAQLSKGLYDVAKAFGNAGKDIKAIARETSTLSRVLSNLGQTLKGKSVATRDAESLAGEIVTSCEDIVEDSKTLLRVLQPLSELAVSHYGNAVLRIRWLLERSRFAAHKQSLDSLQSILTLLLTSMSYAVSVEANESQDARALLRDQLENTMSDVQDQNSGYLSITRLTQNENKDQGSLQIEQAREPASISTDNVVAVPITQNQEVEVETTSKNTSSIEGQSLGQNSSNSGDHSETQAPLSNVRPNAMALTLRPNDEQMRDSYESEMAEGLQLMSPEGVLDFNVKLDFLQRRTLKFADYALDQQTEAKWNSATTRSANTDPLGDAQNAEQTQHNSGHNGSRTSSTSLSGRYPESGASLRSTRPLLSSQILKVQDSRGFLFEFPFGKCQTYEGLYVHLVEVYESEEIYFQREKSPSNLAPDLAVFKPFTLYGTIYGQPGLEIRRQIYEQIIQPGELVTMRFDDNRLNTVKGIPGAHKVQKQSKSNSMVSIFRKRW